MQQYWVGSSPYRFIGVKEIADAFKTYKVGQANAEALATPYQRLEGDDKALVTRKYALNSEASLSPLEAYTLSTCTVDMKL